jgi:chemotaxis protein histidine kinase CheA
MEDADNVVVASQTADTEMKDQTADTAPAPEVADDKGEVKKREEESPSKEAVEVQKNEEEAKKKEEDDLKAREAEEAARKAEAEEKAEKERLAEEARVRQEEEDKKAQAAREAEEQRQRVETQLSEAKSRHREELVSTLPDALSRTLHPTLDDAIEEARLKNEVLEVFTPLQALPAAGSVDSDPAYKSRTGLVVLNVQAAPLLGKAGLDLLLRSDAPGYEKSLAKDWTTFPLGADEKECARAILPGHLLSKNPLDEDSMAIDEDLSFEAELAKTARRIKKAREAQAQLDSADIELRWVKLQDVLDHLHPALQDIQIDVRADFCRPQDRARMFKHVQAKGKTSFFDSVVECWRQEALPQKLEVGTTDVKITHEK